MRSLCGAADVFAYATVATIIGAYRARVIARYLSDTSYLYTVVYALRARQITVDEFRALLRWHV